MARHRMEISVVVQEWRAMRDAPGPDKKIDRLPDCDAALAQSTVIAGRRYGNRLANHRHNFEAAQQNLDLARRLLAIHALQNLAEHEIAHNDLLSAEMRVQLADLTCMAPVEKVYPDGAVDDDQRDARPLRLRARLPRQRYLPNAAPTSCWRRNLTSKRSACSTVCFFVL